MLKPRLSGPGRGGSTLVENSQYDHDRLGLDPEEHRVREPAKQRAVDWASRGRIPPRQRALHVEQRVELGHE